MKRLYVFLLLLFPILLFAQQHQKEWEQIDSLTAIKNYQETLPILEKIKVQAHKDGNSPEWIRAVIAELNGIGINKTKEQKILLSIAHFETNIPLGNAQEQAVLHNIYAKYLLSNLNTTIVNDQKSFLTDPIDTKRNRIDSIFQLSIQKESILLNEKTDNWKEILNKEHYSKIAPTLYHILSFDYYEYLNRQNNSAQKIQALKKNLDHINAENKYIDAQAYLNYYPYLSLNSYQLPEYASLIDSIAKITSSVYSAYAYLCLANSFQTDDDTKAVQYVSLALEKYPNSPWQQDLISLKNDVTKSEIKIEHKTFAPSNEYIPIKVNQTNTDKLFIRVYNITNNPKNHKQYKLNYDSLTTQVSMDADLLYEEEVELKGFDDYKEHSTNYKINPLPYGNYKIVISNNVEFKDDNLYKDVASSDISISDLFISATEKEIYETGYEYSVLLINRKTGRPYANEKVQLYAYKNHQYIEYEKSKTNASGVFKRQTLAHEDEDDKEDLDMLYLFIPKENQFIDLMDLENIEEIDSDEIDQSEDLESGLILTDRSIYRPGQEVFFKAIVYDNQFRDGKVSPNKDVKIYLTDANRIKIDSTNLTTNDFGSVNGMFNLPKKTRNGNFYLSIFLDKQQLGVQYFEVEEYKRPTFKVEFEENKETYTKNDTAVFVGKATSLSGANISDAIVRYKVTYNDKNYRQQTYADSSTTTNATGEFRISFPLSDTTFTNLTDINFSIDATIENQNGEIQNAKTYYQYSSKPWVLKLMNLQNYTEHQWKEIRIQTMNKNQQPLPMNGIIKIYKVLQPSTFLSSVNNFEFKADYHLLDNEMYKKYFPYDFDEVLIQQNPRALVKEYSFDSQGESIIKIDSALFSYGEYQVEAISIQGLDTIKTKSYVKVYQNGTNKFASSQLLTTKLNQSEYYVGDMIIMSFESDAKDIQVVYLKTTQNTSGYETIYFKNGKAIYNHKITEKDLERGNYQVQYFAICNNKIVQGGKFITIKNHRKNLSIQIKTFRDKITPGKAEKWSFTVANQDKKSSIELLASLYDSSLDVFNPHNFPKEFSLEDYSYISGFYFLVNEFMQETSSDNVFDKYSNYQINNKVPRFYTDEKFYSNFLIQNLQSESIFGSSVNSVVNSYSELNEVIVTGLSGRAAGISVFNIEDLDDSAPEILYDQLNDPMLRQEVENLKNKKTSLSSVVARTNLKETAFFYPTLYTDQDGNVTFEFESPEALTRWKLLLFAHSKNLDAGSATFFTQTQKQLMVRPNLPRYFRDGDKIELKVQIQNISDSVQSGTARIEIIDPKTNQVINTLFKIEKQDIDFSAAAKGNTVVSWSLSIPAGYEQVQVKIVAANDQYSDGESQELSILPNKELLLATQKIVLDPNQKATYTVASAGKENRSASISIQSNPILGIISALDYLKNYPYDCTEQTTSKWFALNMLKYINQKYPQIAAYFASVNQDSVQSKLAENTDAASNLSIEEMPWLRAIKNDEEHLKDLAQLFATEDIDAEIRTLETKLKKAQNSDGSMPWFEGSKTNQYISTRILEIIGKTKKLDESLLSKDMNGLLRNLITYLDQQISPAIRSKNYSDVADMAYTRTYFSEVPLHDTLTTALKLFMKNSPVQSAKESAGSAAKSLTLARFLGLEKESQAIFNRLNQEAILDPTKGQYWGSNTSRYNGASLQSYLVEAYKTSKPEALPLLTDWIYYSKQANYWGSTWTTVDAVYSLLLADNPADFVIDNHVSLSVNRTEQQPKKNNLGQESLSFEAKDLRQDLSVEIENNNPRKIYGQIIHSYFEDFPNIKSTEKEISVSKKILVLRNGEWKESNSIKTGDKVKVVLTVVSNQDLNFVHLKDSRAVGCEPIFQPSGYQFRGGYYFTIKDASTNYFFDTLRKGTHVFEYELKTNNSGIFNSGIARIECMYDPTIHSNSENLIVEIE